MTVITLCHKHHPSQNQTVTFACISQNTANVILFQVEGKIEFDDIRGTHSGSYFLGIDMSNM